MSKQLFNPPASDPWDSPSWDHFFQLLYENVSELYVPKGVYIRKDKSGAAETTYGSLQTYTWDTADTELDGITYSSGEFTIGPELHAVYALFITNITFTLANRLQITSTIDRDTGTGYATSSQAKNYATRDANQNEGSVLVSSPERLEDTWKFRVQYQLDRDGTTNATRSTGESNWIAICPLINFLVT